MMLSSLVSSRFDVVVYDATSGGVTAAVSAARHGMRTALLCASWPACFAEGGRRVGGMSSGGLGQTDFGSHPEIIGGLALEFYMRNRRSYGELPTEHEGAPSAETCRLPSAGCNVTFNLEPGRAASIFQDMLREAGVAVFYGAQVAVVRKSGAAIVSIDATVDGNVGATSTFNATVWIDASYEGDLFARAGVTYTIGREGRAAYQESLAGMRAGARSNQFDLAVDPFGLGGEPLPLTMRPVPGSVVGEGDQLVQAYNFRLCVTKNASNRVPWPRPANYSSANYELLIRYINACTAARTTGAAGDSAGTGGNFTSGGCQLGYPSCNTAAVPGSKFDSNNCGGISSDLIGGSWGYPEADYGVRRAIWFAHLQYQQGLLWTMAHDQAVPSAVRDEMAGWGLCRDEFSEMTISPHWPPSLYVRAARRLVGEDVFTQNSPAMQRAAGGLGNSSIGLGGYNFDSHNAQRLACRNASACYGAGPDGANASLPFAWCACTHALLKWLLAPPSGVLLTPPCWYERNAI